MSKILEKNLAIATLSRYLKQCAVWVTGLKNKYWQDPLRLQKRFISDIAHELRTPLAVIKTNDEVAMMDEGMDPKIRKVFESNIEELDRLSEIINNLLSFNDLVRPDRVPFTNVNIGPVIDGVVGKLRNLAAEKHLEITIKKIPPYVVWGNAAALEQIVSNLLTNSINYTGQNGHITIRVAPDYMGSVLLHIEDNGMGITKSDLLHIFEPFYRAERSRNRKTGSSGLGLTIVRELVKMHAGRITIKSSENAGTVAIVTLPYGKGSDQETIDISNLNEISASFSREKKAASP